MSSSFSCRCLQTGDKVGHVGIFDPALRTVAPLTFSLVQLPPSPSLCEKYSVYTYTCTVCKGVGGLWGSWPQTDTHLPVSPFTGKIC